MPDKSEYAPLVAIAESVLPPVDIVPLATIFPVTSIPVEFALKRSEPPVTNVSVSVVGLVIPVLVSVSKA